MDSGFDTTSDLLEKESKRLNKGSVSYTVQYNKVEKQLNSTKKDVAEAEAALNDAKKSVISICFMGEILRKAIVLAYFSAHSLKRSECDLEKYDRV